MQYFLQLWADQMQWADPTDPRVQADFAAYAAYTQALKDAGVFVAGEALQPTMTATTVRVSADGKTSVLDGPYVETKEQLGGFYTIEVANLDEAIAWAARCPGASHGAIEVRPVMAY